MRIFKLRGERERQEHGSLRHNHADHFQRKLIYVLMLMLGENNCMQFIDDEKTFDKSLLQRDTFKESMVVRNVLSGIENRLMDKKEGGFTSRNCPRGRTVNPRGF